MLLTARNLWHLIAITCACALMTHAREADDPFVRVSGPDFIYQGNPFRFAGTNNYYLMYASQFMIDDALKAAADNRMRVVRMWASLEIGNADGSNSVHGAQGGVYFQFWNGSEPAYNDNGSGLLRLDYALFRAGRLGLKVILPLVNNWKDFGGMDQYVRWRGGRYHEDFYNDPLIRQWFKNWIAHLLNRVNRFTGIRYKDDPTIMMWELANEPRCKGSGTYPTASSCTTLTLLDWARDISAFLKAEDPNHLISAGDEGFFCNPGSPDWTENCRDGVDTVALASLPAIDALSFHLYPGSWGRTVQWGTDWIRRHAAAAKTLGKPAVLGEFGFEDQNARLAVYRTWMDAAFESGISGALFWMLAGLRDDLTPYPDYDGFRVLCPEPVCLLISNYGRSLETSEPLVFAPVAGSYRATTRPNTAVSMDVAANSVAYVNSTLVPSSIDLDPAREGQQTVANLAGGQFELQPNGAVRFTPARDFVGDVPASFTIRDNVDAVSNVATLLVTVRR
ncbi:MAG TPA: cellulase family glycosylhydrolase [Bryobacteraceae bacterium]|nr:cellulase family glycosylhydrolase [Bryobacteraceae bacterium]